MHGAEGGFVVLWVELVVVDPDVFPEAQTHHVQVIAAVTEGTGQLHKHCRKKQNRQRSSSSYGRPGPGKKWFVEFRECYLSCLQSQICPA